MLVSRCAVQFSLGTFFKHLPVSNPATLCPYRFGHKTLTATAIRSSSYFETLDSRQKEQVHLYVDTLLQWNQKMNLTAVKEADEVMERHIEDSLAIIPPIRNSDLSHCSPSSDNLRLVDVGSGAGLPGLILAIACPGKLGSDTDGVYEQEMHFLGIRCWSYCVEVVRGIAEVPSFVLMGIPHGTFWSSLLQLGDACSRRDLTAIHEILENIGYKDDGMTNERSFKCGLTKCRNHKIQRKGEILLLSTRTSEPQLSIIHSSLELEQWFLQQFLTGAYLMSDKPQEAIKDAMQAQVVSPVWHIACYLQAVALSALGMDSEAEAALKEGTMLESKMSKAAG